MQKNIKETREYLKARTKDQLDSTTKRTIMENEQMATELHFQSKETERLLDRNQQLMDENSQLRRNLQIHKDLENELARRTHVYQKLIKKMQRATQAKSSNPQGLGERACSPHPCVPKAHKENAEGNSGEIFKSTRTWRTSLLAAPMCTK